MTNYYSSQPPAAVSVISIQPQTTRHALYCSVRVHGTAGNARSQSSLVPGSGSLGDLLVPPRVATPTRKVHIRAINLEDECVHILNLPPTPLTGVYI